MDLDRLLDPFIPWTQIKKSQKFKQVVPIVVAEFELVPDTDEFSNIFSLTFGAGKGGKTTTYFSATRTLKEKLVNMLEY